MRCLVLVAYQFSANNVTSKVKRSIALYGKGTYQLKNSPMLDFLIREIYNEPTGWFPITSESIQCCFSMLVTGYHSDVRGLIDGPC